MASAERKDPSSEVGMLFNAWLLEAEQVFKGLQELARAVERARPQSGRLGKTMNRSGYLGWFIHVCSTEPVRV